MWPYWLMFVVPAVVAFTQPPRPWAHGQPRRVLDLRGGWIPLTVIAALLVGLRDEVGGDWENYLEHSFEAASESLAEALARGEPAYWFVTWATATTSWHVYLANLIFGCIFSIGLMVFCRAQPRPWLALAIAVPYMVIVLGMGYTRQGVALGLAMIGLVALSRRKTFSFVCWVAAGALFHKSAVLLIPLGMIASPRNKMWTALWVGVACLVLYDTLLRDSVETLTTNYIEAEYQSEGALVRVLMNVLPAMILLLYRKRFHWTEAERNMWMMISLLALSSAVWLLVSPSSTAVDRVALYLIPLQLYVFTRVPDLMNRGKSQQGWVAAVLAYYCAVQFVWLFFATHAPWWLPYRFYPLQGSWF
jgi:hypothetical protein